MTLTANLVAIVPCNDADASEAFYRRLGFMRPPPTPGDDDNYRILHNAQGAQLHLNAAIPAGWVVPGQNPFGVYLYTDTVRELAREFPGEIIEKNAPEYKPWGMFEFALSDPDGTLVRVGWPSRLMPPA